MKKSDIDLIIRYSTKIMPEFSKILLNQLDKMPIKTDIQIEIKDSSFSLREYALSEGKPILFRTPDGRCCKEFKTSDIVEYFNVYSHKEASLCLVMQNQKMPLYISLTSS